MQYKPKCLATAIGSMPHSDPKKALDIVFESIPSAPIWPQLPALGLNEQMEIQYSEAMPCRVIDREKKRMYFDTSGDYSEAFAEFYEAYIMAMDPDDGNGDCSAMAISPDYAAGIYALEERLKAGERVGRFLKVHTTGPCSFALTTVDENKRAIYYNEEFRDVIVKALAMKCRWQIQKFKPFAKDIICFVDEPILSAFGSSTYISVHRDDVVTVINEMVEAIHADGALAGVHCCGNTEWSILIDAGVDIVNFDAFGYGETIAVYPDHVKKHLNAGGMLAWGVVPTSVEIRNHTVDTLTTLYEKMVENLAQKSGLDKQLIIEQTVITPSCGTGSMEIKDAEKVLKTTGELSSALKTKFGL
ncbi:MAG: hypothetical protein GY847_06735 [Proteobacteria bacterium]|nr:hypothetical protein [Pseudomonadota bacterium]